MIIVSDMAVTPAGMAVDVQARFGHSVKGLLTEKVTNCGTDIIALTKQVLKGSRSAEVSGTTTRFPSNYYSVGTRGSRCMVGFVVSLNASAGGLFKGNTVVLENVGLT